MKLDIFINLRIYNIILSTKGVNNNGEIREIRKS